MEFICLNCGKSTKEGYWRFYDNVEIKACMNCSSILPRTPIRSFEEFCQYMFKECINTIPYDQWRDLHQSSLMSLYHEFIRFHSLKTEETL